MSMDISNSNYLLVILGIAAIAIEIILGAATGFDLLIIGIILIISGGAGLLMSNFSLALICVAILSFVYVFVGRKFIKTKLSVATTKTSVEKLVGSKAVVTKAITAHKAGQVKIDGEIWRAIADSAIDPGTTVLINSVSGVTLNVSVNQ